MKLVTSAQMREIENKTIDYYKISGSILMENAAVSFCDILCQTLNLSGKKIGIYCGKGNNGGDGYAIARHLTNRGYTVTIVTVLDEGSELQKDAKTNADIAYNMEIDIVPFENAGDFDIVIDAIFGTGFSGEVRGCAAKAIDKINEMRAFVVACDMPSGGDASCGKVSKHIVKADMTITFCAAKYGQFFYPAKSYAGEIFVAPISVPQKYLDSFDTKMYTIDEDCLSALTERDEKSHKGTCGKALICAGSPGMSGACVLSSAAALKTGAGLVRAVTDSETAMLVTSYAPEIMTLKADEKDRADVLLEASVKADGVLCGCGMGVNTETEKLTHRLIKESSVPLVIDADGITNISKNINILKEKNAPIILTPHVGEFSRMTGMTADEIEENRYECAKEFAKKYGVILLLKGANTVCCDEDGTVFVSPRANAALATAGSGDVLAGIIVSLVSQGLTPYDAAKAGVYIHSEAGRRAAENIGIRGTSATDLIKFIPDIL